MPELWAFLPVLPDTDICSIPDTDLYQTYIYMFIPDTDLYQTYKYIFIPDTDKYSYQTQIYIHAKLSDKFIPDTEIFSY